MKIQLSAAALAVLSIYPPVASSAAETQGAPIIVSATRIEMSDVEAPYASEVHSAEDIQRSGATNLYDYLSRYTSMQVQPNYGNRMTPSLDMRGYGIENGFQNLVVTVNGRRLNNIDLSPQLIGGVSLAEIDRIEITKGSGSVLYGDGAMAGTVQIYTKPRSGASVQAYVGTDETRGLTGTVGWVTDLLSLSASVDHAKFGGYSDRDPSGHRDAAESNTGSFSAEFKPLAGLALSLDAGSARIDNRYPGYLSEAQFRHDPGQNNGFDYNRQRFDSDFWSVGADWTLLPGLKLVARHRAEDKSSDFITYSFAYDYDYTADELSLQYTAGPWVLIGGMQTFNGTRTDSASDTSKDAFGAFLQAQVDMGAWRVSAGVRRERFSYEYAPHGGGKLDDSKRLTAWDVGVNYRYSDALTFFGNVNSAYQAPDVDRFFLWFGGFNAFIEPAEVKTVNLGLNHVTRDNRLKATVFHSRLKNEIYYNAETFTNTNLDRTHKYGLELQDTWRITPALTARLNYAWTRAMIDREADGGGAFNGKELPGAPQHSVVVGGDWAMTERSSVQLSQVWRSRTWAINDFDNNNAHRQKAYQSTDLAYRYRLKEQNLELSLAVANLFDVQNGVWVGDDIIYPVDFKRTLRVGVRAGF